ncbi:hypothetical protein GMB86_00180 [Terrilactibacillus sp. BCM23-1]|uniref:Uncharacterized protein n=1 Tax=Terrilactibacillus tamarindi TaxID=2599694 RepID=A0A6N8CKV7_9BACI|nr:hypothetical protein [Terrilactibacillus tamarindi]MTT30429.1 hypothetical protein [Terrilactibacillus tamarindi]
MLVDFEINLDGAWKRLDTIELDPSLDEQGTYLVLVKNITMNLSSFRNRLIRFKAPLIDQDGKVTSLKVKELGFWFMHQNKIFVANHNYYYREYLIPPDDEL